MDSRRPKTILTTRLTYQHVVTERVPMFDQLLTFSKNLPEQYTNRLKDVSEIGKQ